MIESIPQDDRIIDITTPATSNLLTIVGGCNRIPSYCKGLWHYMHAQEESHCCCCVMRHWILSLTNWLIEASKRMQK